MRHPCQIYPLWGRTGTHHGDCSSTTRSFPLSYCREHHGRSRATFILIFPLIQIRNFIGESTEGRPSRSGAKFCELFVFSLREFAIFRVSNKICFRNDSYRPPKHRLLINEPRRKFRLMPTVPVRDRSVGYENGETLRGKSPGTTLEILYPWGPRVAP